MTRATKPVPMACISIGFEDYLMPADKAMKVAELMQSAFQCHKGYESHGHIYTPGEQPRVEFAFVKPGELRKPQAGAGARQIGYEGTK